MRTSSKPWYWKAKDAWYVQIDRKQVMLAKGKAKKAEAKRRWHELMSEGLPRDAPFQLCIDRYLTRIGPPTHRSRKVVLDAFARHVGKVPASRLTKRHVETFIKPNWSPSTTRSAIKTILACLNRAVKDGLLDANPVKDVEKPAWERREHIMTPEELQRLLAAAREPFRTLLIAMAETGCRPQEICGVRVENCLPDQGMWLVENKTRNQTGLKMRPIYLTAKLVELTRGLMAGRTEGHLFLNRYGKPWRTDTLRCRFKRLREKLGLGRGVLPYGTRHRFASDAINGQRLDSLVVARLMGHSDPAMLARTYFREDASAMQEAMEKARGNT
ncbi:site-specific tyrosine recombinase XerC [Aquisphaera giovannonii]|uniref:Site-specific tyrosine recombinase XerC n=1 Tax=Aquisphaera giovannonii TaxID=406548 RepID=A0A5B9VV62_9BACT|nr:tyrosine-type recombinase/integrase [Aquisphaera giovannonii]QEH32122.1 site-specific tyrosine recombinase XerC [Aquisphaera giovannonii]